jgi:hypothetical protein
MRDEFEKRRGTAEHEWIAWNRAYWWDQCPSPTAATRLGDGTITIATPGLRSPFDGEPIEALPVRLNWLRGVTPTTAATVDGSLVRIGTLTLRYEADGVQKIERSEATASR